MPSEEHSKSKCVLAVATVRLWEDREGGTITCSGDCIGSAAVDLAPPPTPSSCSSGDTVEAFPSCRPALGCACRAAPPPRSGAPGSVYAAGTKDL